MQEAKERLRLLMKQYVLAEISVSHFVEDLVETQGSSGMPVPIEHFQKTVHQYLINPLRDRIKEVVIYF